MEVQKPKDFDTAQGYESFERIELGGHKLVIKKVEGITTSTGIPQLKISFDTTAQDKQPKFYENAYRNDTRSPKKWSGETRLFLENRDGTTNRQFKTFCTAVKDSNAGFNIKWADGDFGEQFRNKLVGGVFGLEEYLDQQNDKREIHKLFWFRKIDGIEKVEAPKPRLLSEEERLQSKFDPVDSFLDDDELPF